MVLVRIIKLGSRNEDKQKDRLNNNQFSENVELAKVSKCYPWGLSNRRK